MYHNLLFVAAAIAPSISAIALPRATTVADSLNARNAAPAPTDGPALVRRDLVERGYTYYGPTCGYIDEDKDEPLACNDGYICKFWPALPALSSVSLAIPNNAWNCIPNPESASNSVNPYDWVPATKCKEYGDSDNTKTYGITKDGTLQCGSDNKKCATYIFPTAPPVVFKSIFPDSSSVAADAPYTGLFCGPDAVTETVYPSPTN